MSQVHHSQSDSLIPFRDNENNSEEWRAAVGWEGYDISNQGGLRSRRQSSNNPKVMRPGNSRGRLRFGLRDGTGKRTYRFIHQLVLETFVGPCPQGMICRHLDGNKTNNRVENLCWGTSLENAQDKFIHGTCNHRTPEKLILFFDPFIPIEAILLEETWKSISGSLWYEVSSHGRIRSYCKHGKTQEMLDVPFLMKQTRRRLGHMEVGISFIDSGLKFRSVHRLVLEAFSPPTDSSLVCRHVDGNASNNHILNLKWGTYKENGRDKVFHGTSTRGEKSHSAKLTANQVLEIRRRLANGEIGNRLAKEYGVEEPTICCIRTRHTWKHI